MTAPKIATYSHDNLISKRGWTDELVAKHLPEPDVLQQYPRDKNRAPERLYLRGRVVHAERTEDVAAVILPRLVELGEMTRVQYAAAMKEAAEIVEIVVERLPLHELKIRALEAVYDENARRGRKAPAVISESWLLDIAFKFAVRRLVDYDQIIAALPARLSKPEVYALCRARIEAAISEAYPAISPPPASSSHI